MLPRHAVSLRNAGYVTLFLILASIHAVACSCHQRAHCQSFQTSDAIFVADVLLRRVVQQGEEIGASRSPRAGNVFRVRVVERFSGPTVGQEVSIETGIGGGDCAYVFDVGRRYLIDAVSVNNILFTSLCSLTGPATPENVVLRELKQNALGKRTPDVSGVVTQNGPPLKWGDERALQGVRVSLQMPGESALTTMTDKNGGYFFDKVPTGTYQVLVNDLPPNLAVSGSDLEPFFTSHIGELSVPEHPNGSSACHLSISAGPSGSISGRVSGSKKFLSELFVTAFPITENGQTGEALTSRSPEDTGAFKLSYLPPGRYVLKFERGSRVIGRPLQVGLTDGEQRQLGKITLGRH
jgi:hypothetical protein